MLGTYRVGLSRLFYACARRFAKYTHRHRVPTMIKLIPLDLGNRQQMMMMQVEENTQASAHRTTGCQPAYQDGVSFRHA